MKKLIYLEDAIDAIKDADVLVYYDTGTDTDDACELTIRATKGSIIESVKVLPSAEPERKRGRWIVHYECPKCGEITKDFTEYCPFCNADMRGEQDE